MSDLLGKLASSLSAFPLPGGRTAQRQDAPQTAGTASPTAPALGDRVEGLSGAAKLQAFAEALPANSVPMGANWLEDMEGYLARMSPGDKEILERLLTKLQVGARTDLDDGFGSHTSISETNEQDPFARLSDGQSYLTENMKMASESFKIAAEDAFQTITRSLERHLANLNQVEKLGRAAQDARQLERRGEAKAVERLLAAMAAPAPEQKFSSLSHPQNQKL